MVLLIIFMIIFIVSACAFIFAFASNKDSEEKENNVIIREKLHIAHVDVFSEKKREHNQIIGEKFPPDCIIHNYPIKDYGELPVLLDKIYDSNVRFFIGFFDSEMVKRSLDFFRKNTDAAMISCGCTSDFSDLPENVHFLAPPNSKYVKSLISIRLDGKNHHSSPFANWTVLYQKGNFWAISLLKEINNYGRVYSTSFDPFNPDWREMDDFIFNRKNPNLLILEQHKEYLSTIIDRYNTANVYFVDSYEGKLTYEKKGRDVYCVEQFVEKSDLAEKYENRGRFVNLYDSITVFYKMWEEKKSIHDVNVKGYGGDIFFGKGRYFRKKSKTVVRPVRYKN
jgi:hypothetical protein